MAGVLLLSCFSLAVAGVISVQSATNPVRRDAQQLTEEPLREKKSAWFKFRSLGEKKLSKYRHSGLFWTPQFDSTAKPTYYGLLHGGEYGRIPGHSNHDVPCSVCLAPQSTAMVVPATLTCPPGWTPQYTGHLVSQHHAHQGDEYVCLDGSPEDDSSGVRDDNGLLFYYVVTVCGSLPCPPYINDKVVTCVVCSK